MTAVEHSPYQPWDVQQESDALQAVMVSIPGGMDPVSVAWGAATAILRLRWEVSDAAEIAASGATAVCGCGSATHHFDRPCDPVTRSDDRAMPARTDAKGPSEAFDGT